MSYLKHAFSCGWTALLVGCFPAIGFDGCDEIDYESTPYDTDSETGWETDSEDVCNDTDGNEDGEMIACEGGLYLDGSELCWQDPPLDQTTTYEAAVEYCAGLDLQGADDWRLPTIFELREIIDGCIPTMPGGNCEIDEDDLWALADNDCMGCDNYLGGPGTCDCYRHESLSGICTTRWASTAWYNDQKHCRADFEEGALEFGWDVVGAGVRCVRELGPESPDDDAGVSDAGEPDAG